MICIKKNWKVEFLTQTSHQRSYLPDSQELALAFGHANQNWDVQFARGREDRLQQNQIRNVEVVNSHSLVLRLHQNFS